MAHPRRIIPWETYLVTRRCAQRAFGLRPCMETNQIFMYCLAFAAERTGVIIHAACVMSNHHHLVVTDPRGVLPDFLRELHRLIAKAMNAAHGAWENFWATEPCNVVRLGAEDDVMAKIAYVVANPVAAGLVEEPREWPGFLAWGERAWQVMRPTSYFREGGRCPGELTLRIEPMRPHGHDSRGALDWSRRLGRIVGTKVTEARRALRSAGRTLAGRKEVLQTSLTQRARSYETRFGWSPTFASGLKSVRDRLRDAERQFRCSYRLALEHWRGGERDVPFPFGTWSLAVFYGAVVGPPPQ